MSPTLKGRFKPTHPEKYRGDYNNIWYRSSWEFDVMKWLDRRKDVIWWASEERCVWYENPVTKKNARYFPDFIVHYNRDGVEVTEMIEVKPQKHIDGPPTKPKRRTKAWMKAVETYMVNQNKWHAAMGYCESRGWNFRLLSEKNISSWQR